MLLTPELAERVVERFAERQAERQRADAAERERMASLTRIQELADLLGTTPEDVRALAQEEAKHSPPIVVEREEKNFVEKPRWPLHLAYLAALGLVLAWGLGPKPSVPTARPTTSSIGVTPLLFDPYSNGYVRNPGMPAPWSQDHELLVSPSILPPPAGLRLKLITPLGDKSVAGPPGKVADTAATFEAAKRSIRSLLSYEESLQRVEGEIPPVDYERAPSTQNDAAFQGRPTLIGWHDVEVSNGLGSYRALLPDRRYAKDLVAYEKAMNMRLKILLDAKFFPSLPPGDLRSGSIELSPSVPLPKGTAIMAWDAQQTFWARGTSDRTDAAALRAAIAGFVRESAPRLPSSKDPSNLIFVRLVYPGGERFTNQTVGANSATDERLNDLVEQAERALNPSSAPHGVIRYGPPGKLGLK